MRPIVAYDDIASAPSGNAPNIGGREKHDQGYKKNGKGRQNHYENGFGQNQPAGALRQRNQRHWDEPENMRERVIAYEDGPSSSSLPGTATGTKRKREEEDDPNWEWEHRELTHEEIWDDSALIEAWDAAMEEYTVLNGPQQRWKAEPLHKSALWYNDQAVVCARQEELEDEDPEATFDEAPGDSHPVDFDSFVPSHNPNLTNGDPSTSQQPAGVPLTANLPGFAFQSSGGTVGDGGARSQAFQKVVQSWYWAGYWTAMYQSMGRSDLTNAAAGNGDEPNSSNAIPDDATDILGDATFLPSERE